MSYEKGWEYQPDLCDCDGQFLEWMADRAENNSGDLILHMGTGLHHMVGMELFKRNTIVGLTYSPEELLQYTSLCANNQVMQINYTVLFGDIHLINTDILPIFDVITLFHLGEILPTGHSALVGFSMYELLRDLSENHLKTDGYILAYAKSAAASMSIPLFDAQLQLVEVYKDLRIYKRK